MTAMTTIKRLLSTRFLCFSFTLLSALLFSEEIALFSPPPKWECAAPSKDLSSSVCIGFLGSGKNPYFRPSLNLASEEVDLSLKEYVQAVKKLHQTDPLLQIRDLGSSSCKMGPSHLLELTSKTPYGEVRILQFICLYQKKAYVLTGALLKEESVSFYSDLLKSFHSLCVVEDLISPLSKEEKILLEEKVQGLKKCAKKEQKKARESFDHFIAQAFKEQGAYWQILMLKKTHEEISFETKKQQ